MYDRIVEYDIQSKTWHMGSFWYDNVKLFRSLIALATIRPTASNTPCGVRNATTLINHSNCTENPVQRSCHCQSAEEDGPCKKQSGHQALQNISEVAKGESFTRRVPLPQKEHINAGKQWGSDHDVR